MAFSAFGMARAQAWIVQAMCQKWGPSATWVSDEGEHPHEANYLKLDCSKSAEFLNWKPQMSLQQSLDLIIEWHRSYKKNEDMRQLTLQQMRHYQELIH